MTLEAATAPELLVPRWVPAQPCPGLGASADRPLAQVHATSSHLGGSADSATGQLVDIGLAHGLQAYPFDGDLFPWSAVGRVEVEGGWASGALVGPRHLLTASHVVVWPDEDPLELSGDPATPGPTRAGWLRFTPGAQEDHEPYGSADAVAVHFLRPVRPPSIGALEERVDYAVVVLDRPIGEQAGWLGVRSFSDAWNGKAVWGLAGYRGTSARATRPFYTGGVWMVVHEEQDDDSHVIFHLAGVTVGQSGGPVVGQWPGQDGPHVVAVQSWANEFVSGASGGQQLVDLVRTARAIHP